MTRAKRRDELVKRRWEPGEDAVIRSLYPTATCPELLAALPGRTMSAIRGQANILGVHCVSRRHLAKVVSPVIEREGVRGKACVKCLEWKPLENFAKHSTCAEGRRNYCTTCEGRRAYKNNSSRVIANVRRYQDENPAKVREVKRAAGERRRARKRGLGSEHVTTAQLRELFSFFDGKCAYCGEQDARTLDHVVPLCKGGPHAMHNLLPACSACNSDKHSLTLEEWSAKRARRS